MESQLLFSRKDCGFGEISQPWNRERVSLYLPLERKEPSPVRDVLEI